VRASHFRYVSKTISITKDLDHRRDSRTCHNKLGILDVSRKILDYARLLIRCHSIPQSSVSQLRTTSNVLWQHLHTSYPSRARVSVDSNLAIACEVLGVVDELLMNPVNFHVDYPSPLINGCFN
jgi:hypothetical protein